MRISDWSSDVCSSDLCITPDNRCCRGTALSDHFSRRLDGRDLSVGGLIRARSSADIQDSFCRSQSPSDHHPNPRVGFPEIRIIDPDRIVGSTHRLPHVSTITIQETPKRSAIMPKRGLQKVLRSEEHTSELQSLMRISYAVFCLKK